MGNSPAGKQLMQHVMEDFDQFQILDFPIWILNLPNQLKGVLRARFGMIGQMLRYPSDQLVHIPGIGHRNLCFLDVALNEYGLNRELDVSNWISPNVRAPHCRPVVREIRALGITDDALLIHAFAANLGGSREKTLLYILLVKQILEVPQLRRPPKSLDEDLSPTFFSPAVFSSLSPPKQKFEPCQDSDIPTDNLYELLHLELREKQFSFFETSPHKVNKEKPEKTSSPTKTSFQVRRNPPNSNSDQKAICDFRFSRHKTYMRNKINMEQRSMDLAKQFMHYCDGIDLDHAEIPSFTENISPGQRTPTSKFFTPFMHPLHPGHVSKEFAMPGLYLPRQTRINSDCVPNIRSVNSLLKRELPLPMTTRQTGTPNQPTLFGPDALSVNRFMQGYNARNQSVFRSGKSQRLSGNSGRIRGHQENDLRKIRFNQEMVRARNTASQSLDVIIPSFTATAFDAVKIVPTPKKPPVPKTKTHLQSIIKSLEEQSLSRAKEPPAKEEEKELQKNAGLNVQQLGFWAELTREKERDEEAEEQIADLLTNLILERNIHIEENAEHDEDENTKVTTPPPTSVEKWIPLGGKDGSDSESGEPPTLARCWATVSHDCQNNVSELLANYNFLPDPPQ